MFLLEGACGDPALDLALDDALQGLAEAGHVDGVLRLWHPTETFVVLGYGCRIDADVDRTACRRLGVPILRRRTGGGTVLQSPGCLNYAVVLPAEHLPRSAREAQCFVLRRVAAAIQSAYGLEPRIEGFTDLALEGKKVAGTAARRQRKSWLVHGSLLLRPDLEQMEALLRIPARQPEYRRNRSHRAFLRGLGGDGERLRAALIAQWKPDSSLPSEFQALARSRARALVLRFYGRPCWIERL